MNRSSMNGEVTAVAIRAAICFELPQRASCIFEILVDKLFWFVLLLFLDHLVHCDPHSKPVQFPASRSSTRRLTQSACTSVFHERSSSNNSSTLLMRSQAMVGFKLAVLLVLVGVVAGDLTVTQTIINGCTSDVTVLCKTVNTPFDSQTLTPAQSTKFTITSTLEDPTLTCNFTSVGVPKLQDQPEEQREIWNLLFSGFSDFPWMSCIDGCTWKTQDDGIYWAQQDGSFKLFNVWV